MRVLDPMELDLVSGGSPKWEKAEERAAPGTDVTKNLPGNRTGWCRGYGNMKIVGGEMMLKHEGTTDCGVV